MDAARVSGRFGGALARNRKQPPPLPRLPLAAPRKPSFRHASPPQDRTCTRASASDKTHIAKAPAPLLCKRAHLPLPIRRAKSRQQRANPQSSRSPAPPPSLSLHAPPSLFLSSARAPLSGLSDPNRACGRLPPVHRPRETAPEAWSVGGGKTRKRPCQQSSSSQSVVVSRDTPLSLSGRTPPIGSRSSLEAVTAQHRGGALPLFARRARRDTSFRFARRAADVVFLLSPPRRSTPGGVGARAPP